MHTYSDPWCVGAWMTANPETVPPNTPVRDAFYRMRSGGFRHLIVLDGGRLAGIVTDRDLRRPDLSTDPDGWDEWYRLDTDYEVKDVMTRDVATVRSHTAIEKALNMFVRRKFGALPVLDKKNQIIGILTTHDALRALAKIMAEYGDVMRRRAAKKTE
ncbi:MAG: CBS domain-containing protein [Nitrospirae bacterium]|nr:CBS domain-containing protein [Nitrospirota bacterium]